MRSNLSRRRRKHQATAVLAAVVFTAGMATVATASEPANPAEFIATSETLQSDISTEVLEVVERFAPVLAFDRDPRGFPMDAQTYFEQALVPEVYLEDGVERLRWEFNTTLGVAPVKNDDFDSLTEGDGVPTYFIVEDEPLTGALRIQYWWFYGYQHTCWAPFVGDNSNHEADWEAVLVTTSADRSRIDRLTYKQHGGWYTRSTINGNGEPEPAALAGWIGDDTRSFPWYSNADSSERRPLIYVGRVSHGAYHFGNTKKYDVTCRYWLDWRNPIVTGDNHTTWDTSGNLIAVDHENTDQSWMLAEAAERDQTLTYPHNGNDYAVGDWLWGWGYWANLPGSPPWPQPSPHPAIDDGPVQYLNTLWEPAGRFWADCKNSNSGDRKWPDTCTKSAGWPALVNLSIEPSQSAVPGGYKAEFRIHVDQLDLGASQEPDGGKEWTRGTQNAEEVTVDPIELTPGLNWEVDGGDASCELNEEGWTCSIGEMAPGDSAVITFSTMIDGTVSSTTDIDAAVTWKARQQPVYSDHAAASLDLNVCAGEIATVVGTDGDDVLIGTDARDVIMGLGGNDTIYAKGDSDLVCAGTGDDIVRGGNGNDKLIGGPGNDRIYASGGSDVIKGGSGDDKASTRDGRLDRLYGGPGSDTAKVDNKDIVVGFETVLLGDARRAPA